MTSTKNNDVHQKEWFPLKGMPSFNSHLLKGTVFTKKNDFTKKMALTKRTGIYQKKWFSIKEAITTKRIGFH